MRFGKLIHDRFAGVMIMLSRNLACRICDWNTGEAVEQKEELCDEVVTVK